MQHNLSFRNRNYSNSTELSKQIWTLKDNNANFAINRSILATAPAYSNKSKQCDLCLTEKLYLVRAKKPSLLNQKKQISFLNAATRISFTQQISQATSNSSIESLFHT